MSKESRLRIKDIGEVDLISRIAKLITTDDADVVVPIGDDAAVVQHDAHFLQVITTDILVEGVHFSADTHTPLEIGYKALVVNISDVAAMAGIPQFALISLGLNPETYVDFVEDFYRGALKAAGDYNLTLVGGDTTKSPEMLVNVVVLGRIERDMLRKRSDAQEEDLIVVTGDLGGSVAGLYLLTNPKMLEKVSHATELKKAHLVPMARVTEARIAAEQGARAMEDISDGLASEITHICEMSNVGAEIYVDRIPISPGVHEVALLMGEPAHNLALYGGEDYELVFTVSRSKLDVIQKEMQSAAGIHTTVVGRIVSYNKGISLVWPDGSKTDLANLGYEHF